MKLLLDTHTFLWWNTEDPQLSSRAREMIADGQNEIFLSAASSLSERPTGNDHRLVNFAHEQKIQERKL